MELKQKLSETACVSSEHRQLEHQERERERGSAGSNPAIVHPMFHISLSFCRMRASGSFSLISWYRQRYWSDLGYKPPAASRWLRSQTRGALTSEQKQQCRDNQTSEPLQSEIDYKASFPKYQILYGGRDDGANVRTSPNVGITTQFNVKPAFLLNGEHFSLCL